MGDNKSVYSNHTFVFPFLWNNGGKVRREDFQKCLDNEKWKIDIFGSYRANDSNEKRQRYAAYQYFNEAARTAIYTAADNQEQIVRNYRFMPDIFVKNDNAVIYKIEKDGQEYKLRVNGIRLKLYDTGVGLLVFELENHNYHSVDDVNRINEFGRRICRPYYSYDEEKDEYLCSLVADCISICGPAINMRSELAKAKPADYPQETELAEFIKEFFINGEYSVTIRNTEADTKKKFFIEPIIDDRMFVCCFLLDKGFTHSLAEFNGTEYRYIYDALAKSPDDSDNASRMLYEYVFVDGNGLSCQSRKMLQNALKEHVYDRWIENYSKGQLSGTIYGITEYSFVCATASEYVREAYLTEYVELAMLVLAQRASLLAFERNISRVSRAKKEENVLQMRYVDFDSKYLLVEASAQQQGIEIYNMLLDKLFINEQKSDVEKQIASLFNLKNYKSSRFQNGILLPISVFGFWGIIETALDCFASEGYADGLPYQILLCVFLTVLTGIVVWRVMRLSIELDWNNSRAALFIRKWWNIIIRKFLK